MRKTIWLLTALALAGFLFCIWTSVHAAVGDTARFVGQRQLYDGRPAVNAYLDNPQGMVIDTNGNIFIADTKNNSIRRVDGQTQRISAYVNAAGEYGQKDGNRLAATLAEPQALALDTSNRLYIADTLNSTIRRVEGNTLRTLPISGLSRPRGLTIRGNEIYIADTGHNRVVKTSINGGALQLVAAPMSTPTKLDWIGRTLYAINEGNGSVIEINLSTKTQTRVAAGFQDLGGLAVYNTKSLYVTAGKQGVLNQIYRVDPSAKTKTLLAERRETEWLNWAADTRIYNDRIYVLFGGGSSLFSFDLSGQDEQKVAGLHRFGDEFGSSTKTVLGRPHALIWSNNGLHLYFVENNKLAEYNYSTGQTTFLAGHVMDNYVEGQGATARFSDPTQLAISPDNKTLYLPDRNNHRIRKFDLTTNTSSYVTGAGKTNFYGTYTAYQEGGPCAEETGMNKSGCAYFNRPTGIAVNKAGTKLYVADSGNNRIREVDIKSGRTRLLAGSGQAGFTDGFGPAAKLNGPFNLALDQNGINLYITDKQNHAIRRLDLRTLHLTTVTGAGRAGYREGLGRQAVLNYPEGIIVGRDGQLYFSDAGNQRIRAYSFSTKATRTISGSGERGLATGRGTIARWNSPKGLAQRGLDGSALYICDFYNDMIKRVSLR